MQFDLVLTNPPFQDRERRKKTPHKLWIDFTLHVFENLVREGGSLVQVSPSSFSSPSSKILRLMQLNQTNILRFDNSHHFPGVGSTFSDYWIEKAPNTARPTRISVGGLDFDIELDEQINYLPNDLCRESMSIHSKVIFRSSKKLAVEWDYVTAHNIKRFDTNPSLSVDKTETHFYPIFHTNKSTWWSSVPQQWSQEKKVMWTRSGYTKPFYDDGTLGGTDMVYFIRVPNRKYGLNLAANLNKKLFKYIFSTARWSGFGNERVFTQLPRIPWDKELSDTEIYSLFKLSAKEVNYLEGYLGGSRSNLR